MLEVRDGSDRGTIVELDLLIQTRRVPTTAPSYRSENS